MCVIPLKPKEKNYVSMWRLFTVGDESIGTALKHTCMCVLNCLGDSVLACPFVFKRGKCCQRSSRRWHKCWVLVKQNLSSCTRGCIEWIISHVFSPCVCAPKSFVWNNIGILAVRTRVKKCISLCLCEQCAQAMFTCSQCTGEDGRGEIQRKQNL